MSRNHPLLAGSALLGALALGAPARPADSGKADAARLHFDRTVAPLLVRRCLSCHSGPKPRGDLDLTNRKAALEGGDSGDAIVPGKPEKSLLWDYVNRGKMPPKKPLPAAEKAILRAWIAAGAPWGTDPIDPFRFTTAKRAGYDWWALRPVKQPRVPAVKDARWLRNPIDAFVLHRLEAKGLRPSAPADRRTLIRRLSFDLRGLPPSPAEVAAFARDDSPGAYERLVDRYLNSPHYGIRWARHWLDVVRFGESNGFEFDEFRPDAWPYRDWVVNSLNRDLPYDEFARLQLAGDVLHPGDAGAIRATGFLVAGAYDTVGQTQQSAAMRKVVRQDELEDIVGTVGQTFLGLTVHCARCHDHKFDPVRQLEYYRMATALSGVRHGVRDLPPSDRQRAAARRIVARLQTELEGIEAPVRAKILAERKARPQPPPQPIARWDFRQNLKDGFGNLHGTAHGQAALARGGLRVDGKTGYVATAPLAGDLQAKTLEAWVVLDNLRQRGGGVLGVQTLDGRVFDALVFGERAPGKWQAGSENFIRTKDFQGNAETEAVRRPVHLALVYDGDGTITAYRNGRVYGRPYQTSGPVYFRANKAQVIFGLRHSPRGPNKLLAGVIHRASLYDRALTAEEVAVSAGTWTTSVAPETLADRLTPKMRARWGQLRGRLQKLQALLSGSLGKVYAVLPRQPITSHVLIRGNPAQPGAKVSAGGVAALAGPGADFQLALDAPEGERRRRLAGWISHPKNPLFARVIVNRLWHYHFGTGLVDTPNDFGFNGGRPSHPELLDWLAAELVRHRWSLKRLHRLIVTSAAYRQSSRANSAAARVDAGNRLLWRMSPRRLEAEALRDATLFLAGQLNRKMGGPGFRDFRIVRSKGTSAMFYPPRDAAGGELNRRTLYRTWSRGGRSGLLDAFDCPDPSTTSPRRAVTTTPLQALAMLNNAHVLRMAKSFAERLRREAGDISGQVRRAYELAYGRLPDEQELSLAERVVRKHGLAVLTRAIFNSNEFLYID
jgi:hypothetical protein